MTKPEVKKETVVLKHWKNGIETNLTLKKVAGLKTYFRTLTL